MEESSQKSSPVMMAMIVIGVLLFIGVIFFMMTKKKSGGGGGGGGVTVSATNQFQLPTFSVTNVTLTSLDVQISSMGTWTDVADSTPVTYSIKEISGLTFTPNSLTWGTLKNKTNISWTGSSLMNNQNYTLELIVNNEKFNIQLYFFTATISLLNINRDSITINTNIPSTDEYIHELVRFSDKTVLMNTVKGSVGNLSSKTYIETLVKNRPDNTHPDDYTPYLVGGLDHFYRFKFYKPGSQTPYLTYETNNIFTPGIGNEP